MQKVILSIGSLFILFSFVFVGLSACDEDDGDDGGGNNGGNSSGTTPSCKDGYISCGNTGKCCQSGYPYHGSNGKCYTTLAACQKNASSCTQCGSGSSGGTSGGTCSSGYCLIQQTASVTRCCPSDYPYYVISCSRYNFGNKEDLTKKCVKTVAEISSNCQSSKYTKCSKHF